MEKTPTQEGLGAIEYKDMEFLASEISIGFRTFLNKKKNIYGKPVNRKIEMFSGLDSESKKTEKSID